MSSRLKLTRPLVVFDLETTGTNTQEAKIVQLGAVRVEPGDESLTGVSKTWMVNPGMPIPPGSTAVHGITDERVANEPRFGEVADEVLELFSGADLAGYNLLAFDVPVLLRELIRAKRDLGLEGRAIVDVFSIYKAHKPRDLAAALKEYCPGKHFPGAAHDALADAWATKMVLLGQLDAWMELPSSPQELAAKFSSDRLDVEGKFRRGEDGVVRVTFGKHKGVALSEVAAKDAGWLRWLASNEGFLPDARTVASRAAKGESF